MKKFDTFKTIQLILFICITAVSLFVILTDKELYQLIASDVHIRMLCIVLWIALGLSFFFIFWDFSLFSSFKREYRELDFALSSDPVSGIANRYSCDSIIEKYLDKPIPDGIGCIMFDLTNLQKVNQTYGHTQGNELIREFSGILQSTSLNFCFVGRNGGNKFIALFKECNNEKLNNFLEHIEVKVERHNSLEGTYPIFYRYGIAFEEGPSIRSITDLIALSNKRIYNEDTYETT